MPLTVKHLSPDLEALHCTLVVLGRNGGAISARAHSLDRHGAVVSLEPAVTGQPVDAPRGSRVELEILGVPGGNHAARSFHCLGRVVRCSATPEGMVWLVLQFDQMQFRGPDGILESAGFRSEAKTNARRFGINSEESGREETARRLVTRKEQFHEGDVS